MPFPVTQPEVLAVQDPQARLEASPEEQQEAEATARRNRRRRPNYCSNSTTQGLRKARFNFLARAMINTRLLASAA